MRRDAVAVVTLCLLFDSCGGGGGNDDLVEGSPLPPPGSGDELAAPFVFLAGGFSVELMASDLAVPAKLVFDPDGRLFFGEVETGQVRILEPDSRLLDQPFGEIDVIAGGERGLLGLALSPDFASDGLVYAFASVPDPERNQVVRWRDVGDVGADFEIVVDDLPIGSIHNGGDLEFQIDGTLLVSLGDTNDDSLAQQDGALAGRVLRFEADGTIPTDNPIPGDPEYCRGLRNTFDLTVHLETGGVFGLDNGPTESDELNFLQPSKNFEWPEFPPGAPGSSAGVRLHHWIDVITPTGLVFHDGTTWGEEYVDSLFVCSYSFAEIRRLPMSGGLRTDVDEEFVFARLDSSSYLNKPLGIAKAPDGSLWFSTFDSIYRIRRIED